MTPFVFLLLCVVPAQYYAIRSSTDRSNDSRINSFVDTDIDTDSDGNIEIITTVSVDSSTTIEIDANENKLSNCSLDLNNSFLITPDGEKLNYFLISINDQLDIPVTLKDSQLLLNGNTICNNVEG